MGVAQQLKRLRDDESGNALMLMAAGLFPLLGILGGALDVSRTYLAQSRIQQACDAGSLAARKELGGSVLTAGAIPTNIEDKAQRFFAINFRAGMYGTENSSFTIQAGSDTRIDGKASVEVPTTLMRIFNFDKVDVEVTCSADLNLPNIDVVLVLDQSGSMNGARIADLKSAVLEFYDEIMDVAPDNARIRFGVVPYSGAVNVGDVLTAKNMDFLADSHTYQSREAVFKDVGNGDGVNEGDQITVEVSTELLPRNAVQLGLADEPQYHWNEKNPNKQDECKAYAGTYQVGDQRWTIKDPRWIDNYWRGYGATQKGACQAHITKTRTATSSDVRPETFRTVFDYYHYKPMVMNTSQFKRGSAITTPTGTKGANVRTSWNGCIEERQTVATASFRPIPPDALDLDFDLVPSAGDARTQWKPMWEGITFDRGGPAEQKTTQNRSTRGYNCPDAARELREYPKSGAARNADFENYINALSPRGGTMHDIGMLWAARFISPNGIFASENAAAPNGDAIARHIVFMTDGEMGANPANTTAYGNYDMDGRFAGFAPSGRWTENQLATIHNARLDALCTRIKNANITIWTVAFELPLNTHTRGCATGNNRAFSANNREELEQRFRDIAGNIAELRLVD